MANSEQSSSERYSFGQYGFHELRTAKTVPPRTEALDELWQDKDAVKAGLSCPRSLSSYTLGLGTDLVHVPTFATQLAQVGTRFSAVFTDRERALASQRPSGVDASLAARWAGKESVIKAWSAAQWGEAPTLDPAQVDWSEIEVIADRWSRPQIRLRGVIHRQISALVTELAGADAEPQWLISISHDGDYALAFVMLQAVMPPV